MVQTQDPWGITDTLSTEQLDPMAGRLEQRAKEPRFAAMLADYLEAMDIDAARSVLDIGCGTGIAARAIAGRPEFRGQVLGIDISSEFVAMASRLAREERVDARVRFETGDTRSLARADQSFDAIVAHTLLSHVNDPREVLTEARRLLAPGGVMAVFDADWASLTHEAADPTVAKIIDGKPVGMFFAQPRVMRQMSALARDAGLRVAGIRGHVFVEMGRADYWLTGIQMMGPQLSRSGFVSEAKAAAWVAALTKASEAGEYFGSCNYYACLLRRAD